VVFSYNSFYQRVSVSVKKRREERKIKQHGNKTVQSHFHLLSNLGISVRFSHIICYVSNDRNIILGLILLLNPFVKEYGKSV